MNRSQYLYHAVERDGGPAGIRTLDTRIKSPMYPVPVFTVIYPASPLCRRARAISLPALTVFYPLIPEFL